MSNRTSEADVVDIASEAGAPRAGGHGREAWRAITRDCCEQRYFTRTQFAGAVTASEINMRQSVPPCSRKSAVPKSIFRSSASSNGAQPIDRAEV